MSFTSGSAGPVDPTTRPGKRLSAKRFEAVDKLVRGITTSGGMSASYRSGRLHLASKSSENRKSSFAFMGFYKDPATSMIYMKVAGGFVKYASRYNAKIESTTTTPLTHIQIAGTEADPTRVCIQMSKTDGNACSIVGLATEPVDNGSYWYRVIHEAYINDAGTPKHSWNRLNDWIMGSPIR